MPREPTLHARPRSAIDGFARPIRPRRGRRTLVVGLAALGAIKAAAFAALLLLGPGALPATDGAAMWLDSLAAGAGLQAARVEVHGNRITPASQIVAALDLAGAGSQLSLDTAAARHRLEALPWVRTAAVRRVLPDGVAVEIVERKPAFVWRNAGRAVLVDMDGRELSAVAEGDLGLPVLVGAGAGAAGPRLLGLIAQHPAIERRLVEARRIEDRRWTLLLAGGTLLHLPGDGAQAALAWVEALAGRGLIERGLAVIDLRVPGELVIRETGSGPPVAGPNRLGPSATVATGGAP